MNLTVLPYDLPDYRIFEADFPAFHIWQPEGTILVLGQSNKPETSLFTDKALEDNIPVYKRPSGGETVILTPKTLVISILKITEKLEDPKNYFNEINNLIFNGLTTIDISNLALKGISDIAINGKKILGSSIYRKKNKVFYHAVLNISETTEIMSRYIRHPRKEPDYRKGREHAKFVTSLSEQGYGFGGGEITASLEEVLIAGGFSRIDYGLLSF